MAQIRHKELWKKSCHVVRTCSLRPCVLDQVVFQHIPSFTIHHIHELGVTHMSLHNFQGFILKMNSKLRVPLVPKSCPLISSSPAGSCRANAATSFLSERATVARARLMGGARLHWLHYHPPYMPKQKKHATLSCEQKNRHKMTKTVFFSFVVICTPLCTTSFFSWGFSTLFKKHYFPKI